MRELTVYRAEISAIASRWAAESGNCELITGPDTACITPWSDKRVCCCFVAATKGSNPATSPKR